MAPEVKTRKRKAPTPDNEVAKAKKVKQMAADLLPKKRKSANGPDSTFAKKTEASKPKLDEENICTSVDKRTLTGSSSPTLNETENFSKKIKSSANAERPGKELKEVHGDTNFGDYQGATKKLDLETETLYEEHEDASSTGELEDEVIDDQTDALLKGFESDDDISNVPEGKEYKAGDEIPKVGKRVQKKALAAEKASTSGKPGVVYIGRIPHGFYEQEMKQYFSQFGSITNLRLSRNRKTGRSKHFAFVEFESGEVAEIVSKTMDNYLLFGHILKCKLVAPEQVHKNLWIGANKRFKSVPWNKIQGRKLSQPQTVVGWEKRMEKEGKRRAEKKEAMKLLGYEFDTPELKSAKEVLRIQQAQSKTIVDETDGEDRIAIEATKLLHSGESQEKEDSSVIATPPIAVAPEPGRKKDTRTAKSSNEQVSEAGVMKTAPAKGAGNGTYEKVAKWKKNKKHRVI